MDKSPTAKRSICKNSQNIIHGLKLLWAIAVILPNTTRGSKCSDELHASDPGKGFYGDESMSLVLQRGLFHHCELFCHGRGSCVGLSYNSDNGTCIATSKACVLASAHPDYELILYQPVSKYSCVAWVHSRPARIINNGFQAVGRYIYSNTVILPCKSKEHASTTCFYWESAENCLSGGEYLQVGEHCITAWAPYTAGNSLEFGAVQGGSLPDGTSLYVVNLDINDTWGASRWAYGYYRPHTELAYAGNCAPQTKTQMQMLIAV